jgi:hypothetical protein
VQGAAIVTDTDAAAIAEGWALDTGELVEPGPASTARDAVRAAYAALRDATLPRAVPSNRV